MLVDTDVLIWYLRGHEGAAQFLDSQVARQGAHCAPFRVLAGGAAFGIPYWPVE